jgi:hypothetical protein
MGDQQSLLTQGMGGDHGVQDTDGPTSPLQVSAGFAVSLMNTGCKTQGVALLNKCRMVDLGARSAVCAGEVCEGVFA